MATFGNTGVETSSFPMAGDRLFVTRFTLTEDGDVSKLTARSTSDGSGSTGGNWKGVILENSAGVPGAVVDMTAGVSISATDTWFDLTFAAPVELTAGDYFLGVVGDSGSFLTRLCTGGTGHDSEMANGTFDYAGSDTTWPGTDVTYDVRASIYATYTVSSMATAFQTNAF